MGNEIAQSISGARLIAVAGGHPGDLFLRNGAALLRAIAAYGQQS